MPDGMEIGALCTAVKVVMDTVAGIGIVETRPGGVPTWVRNARPLQAFWELDVVSAPEDLYAAVRNVDETPLVQVHGFMPWSYERPDTAAVWRPLVRLVLDALRAERYMNGLTDEPSYLPQLMRNERVPVEDGEKTVLCHHVLIEIRYTHSFQYTET